MPSPHKNLEAEGTLFEVSITLEQPVRLAGEQIDDLSFATIQPDVPSARERGIWMVGDAFENAEIERIEVTPLAEEDLISRVENGGSHVTQTILAEVQEAMSAHAQYRDN